MATGFFSSSDGENYARTLSASRPIASDIRFDPNEYPLELIASYVEENGFKRVACQFPDALLAKAPYVLSSLSRIGKRATWFALGDTSYGDCCIDEITAQHYDADFVLSFSEKPCLAKNANLPSAYVSPRAPDRDVEIEAGETVAVLGEFKYEKILRKHQNSLILPPECFPTDDSRLFRAPKGRSDDSVVVCGRRIAASDVPKIKTVVYVGKTSESERLQIRGIFPNATNVLQFDPLSETSEKLPPEHAFTKRRFARIQKAKTCNVFGLLLGSVNLRGMKTLTKRLSALLRSQGKTTYTVVVGRPNQAKLSNFPEIECWVYVGCPYQSTIDSKDFDVAVPLVTPVEIDVAFGGREWTASHSFDFSTVEFGVGRLNDDDDDSQASDAPPDFSLVGGASYAVSDAFETRVGAHYSSAAGEFLKTQTFRGLAPSEDVVATRATRGQAGIASGLERDESGLK